MGDLPPVKPVKPGVPGRPPRRASVGVSLGTSGVPDRTINRELLAELGVDMDDFAKLSEAEQAYLLQCLEEVMTEGQSITASALAEADYRWLPVSMEQFIDDPEYLGAYTKDLFPACRAALIETFDTDREPVEVILGGSIGWGKTTLAAVGLLYDVYRIGCLRNPHEFYGLMPGAKIAFAIYSTSKEQAADSAFGKLLTWVEGSPYFKSRMPKVGKLTTKMVFSQSPVLIMTGSQEVHAIGKDMFAFLLDEANFLTAKTKAEGEEGRAYAIYNNAKNRLKSRFGQAGGRIPGKVWLISSKRTHASFLENHVAASKNDISDGSARLYEYSQWEVRKPSAYTMPKFRVEIGDRIIPSRILKEHEDPRDGAQVIVVPGEFRKNFENDLDGSLRDIAGVATFGLMRLIQDGRVLEACIPEDVDDEPLTHPFTKAEISTNYEDDIGIDSYFRPEVLFATRNSRYVPRRNPTAARFVHIDIGLTADSMGIACVHQSGFRKVRRARPDGTFYEDRAPIVTTDFMLRITPPKGSEIDISKARAFLVSLRDMGMPIHRVSLDGFQCFTAETRVRLLDGTAPTMAELAERYGEGEFWVYAFDRRTGRVAPGRACNARVTGQKRVAVVTLDNGEVVRCTHDHPWLMRDGEYLPTSALRPGDSLMPLYTQVSERDRHGLDGYEMVQHADGRWQYTHQMVNGGRAPAGSVIHHANFNRRDNTPGNLAVMTGPDHLRLHQAAAEANATFARPGYWTDAKREAQAARARAQHLNPAFRTAACANLIPGQTSPAHRASASARATARNTDPNTAPRRLRHVTADAVMAAAQANPDLSQRELGALLGVSQDVVAARLDEAGVGHARGWRLALPPRNHKVASVVLTEQVEAVYDIEVAEHHNFALAAGVFVHNSRDCMQVLRKIDFDAILYSVDKTDEAYMSLRQAVVEKRIRYYRYETFLREMRELERNIDDRTVDHPKISPETGKRGSKDVSDAVAGATFQCMTELDVMVPGTSHTLLTDDNDAKLRTPHGQIAWELLEKELNT